MSASIHWMPWNSEIGWPNASRSLAYATAASNAACAIPSAWAAIPIRPASSEDMAILKPSPSSPSMLPTGTRQSWRKTCVVAEALIPSFFSFGPHLIPNRQYSTRNAAERLLLAFERGEHEVQPGLAAVRDPVLGPVQDVVVAVAVGLGLHVAGVAAGLRLAQAERADHVAAGEPAQVVLLLLVGAVLDDRLADQRVLDGHDDAVGGVGPRDLLHRQRVLDGPAPAPPYSVGTSSPISPSLPILRDVLGGELLGLVVLGRDRSDLALGELAHRAPE